MMIINPIIEDPQPIPPPPIPPPPVLPPPTIPPALPPPTLPPPILSPPLMIPPTPTVPPVNNEGSILDVLELAPGLAVEIRFINGNWQLVPTKAPPDVEGMIVDMLATKLQDPAISYDEICCLLNALANRRDSLINAWRNTQGLLGTDKPLPLSELPPLATATLEDQLLNDLPTEDETGIEQFDDLDYSYKPEKDKIIIMNSGGYRGRTWRQTEDHIDKKFSCGGSTYRGILSQDISYFDNVILIVCGQWNSVSDSLSPAQVNLLFNDLAHIPKLMLDATFTRSIGLGTSIKYFTRGQEINQISIANITHPITEGVPLGPYGVTNQMYSAILDLPPGYINLAELTIPGGPWPKPVFTQGVGDIGPGIFPPHWPPEPPPPVIYTGSCFAIDVGGSIGFWGLWFPDPLLDRMINFLIPNGQGFTIDLTQTYYDHEAVMITEKIRSYHKQYSDKSMLKEIAVGEIVILDQMRVDGYVNGPQWIKGMQILENFKTIEIDWGAIP